MRSLFRLGLAFLFASLASRTSAEVISGVVKGPDGAPFRGAFVRSQNLMTMVNTWVLSDREGRYRADVLPGEYAVSIKTIGYAADPARTKVEGGGKAVSLDFELKKSRVQWADLNQYQARLLMPEGRGRQAVLDTCFACHSVGRFTVRPRDRDGYWQAVTYMRDVIGVNVSNAAAAEIVEYLGTAFGPNGTAPASPADVPAYQQIKMEADYFSDAALNIVYVDYPVRDDLRPAAANPDDRGYAWYPIDSGVARLNVETGEHKSWRAIKELGGVFGVHETLPLKDGSAVWFTVTQLNALGRFDTKTETFEIYPDKYDGPRVQSMPDVNHPGPWRGEPRIASAKPGFGAPRIHTALMDKDGNIWATGRPLKKFDVKTRQYTNFSEVPDTYGITMDLDGNIWASEFNATEYGNLVRVDPKTNKVSKFKPPPYENLDGRPRRIKTDSKGNIWFGQFHAGHAGRFDPKTGAFKTFKMPGPMPTPYAVAVDRNDDFWFNSIWTGYFGRVDSRTGNVIAYPTPYPEDHARDFDVDAQGRIWFGAEPYLKVGYFYLRN